MNKINEIQILTNVRLSQTQKFVLTKLVIPDSTPLTSYEQTSSEKNVVANRDILVKLGMVEVGENAVQITKKGREALRNENLVDDMGNLTEQGEQYAYAEKLEDIEKIVAQQQNEPMTPDTGQKPETGQQNDVQTIEMPAQAPDGIMPESWSMISDMQDKLLHKQFIKKYSKKS